MSSGITSSDSLFYYNETPWHGLGKKVTKALTAEEAIKAAGLDWEVETVPVYHKVRNMAAEIEGQVAVRRKDDKNQVLSILSDSYVPIQNKEAFGFFDEVVADKSAKYHTAGSLLGGRKIWVLAKLNNGKGSSVSIKGDQVDKYLLLMNGHDGGTALKMFFTPIRVVCNNTLSFAEEQALTGKAATFYARHSEGIKGRVMEARDILGLTTKAFDDFTEKARHLAKFQLPSAEMPKMLVAAFQTSGALTPDQAVDFTDLSSQRQKEFEEVTAMFEGKGKGLDNPKIAGTKWAAYNAVAEFVDYERKHKDADIRLRSVTMGSGAAIKQRAWSYLLKN